MNTTSLLTRTHIIQSRLYLAQMHNRESGRFDFQIAMDLIGAELRRLRLEQGLTIDATAKAVRMSKYRLYQIELGLYIHLGVPQLRRLCAHYGVSHRQVLQIIPDTRFGDIDVEFKTGYL